MNLIDLGMKGPALLMAAGLGLLLVGWLLVPGNGTVLISSARHAVLARSRRTGATA